MSFCSFALKDSMLAFGHQEPSTSHLLIISLCVVCLHLEFLLEELMVFWKLKYTWIEKCIITVCSTLCLECLACYFAFRKNVRAVLEFLMGDYRHKLCFCWVSYFLDLVSIWTFEPHSL